VSAILEARPLTEPVTRPDGFSLADYWREWTDTFENSVYTAEATVRIRAEALARAAFVWAPEMSRVARDRAGEPDELGWLHTVVPIESVMHGHMALLQLGADLEVLGPAELRERFVATARGLSDAYPDAGGG
jgi:predicted DNA-binding transcriptional regulator YafY